MPPQETAGPSQGERVTLYYREGSSDKVYHAAIESSGGGFIVNFAFGRRGATLQTGSKTAKPVAYPEAKKIYDKLVQEKTAKGYTPGEDGTPYQHTDNEQRSTGIVPQLLNPIEEAQLSKYLQDDNWWMQEKFDGRRLLVRKQHDQIIAINRKGLTVGLPQSICAAVLLVGAQHCLIDGEAVGEVYYAFDLLARDDLDLRKSGYAARYEQLVSLIDPAMTPSLQYAESATDAGTKAYLLDKLRQRKREGVVFKDSTAAYSPGRPASGGAQVKLKFYATASCIVATARKGKRSVALELVDRKKRVAIGNVTIPANHPVPPPGAVVEVRYLYAYPGGSLFQPVYLCKRDDVEHSTCLIGQLKFKSGEEADEA